jgi:hypothetical protein
MFVFILFLNFYIIKYKNFYSSLSCCNLKVVFIFLGGCYLKLEKQYFFECVGLGFKVICGYVWQCNVVSILYSHSFCLDAIVNFIFFNW